MRNDGARTHVLPNDMAAEDAEFLEAMLRRHTEPSMLLMKKTVLWSVLKLLMTKARYDLFDAGFDTFLSIIEDMFPKENKVPANTYYAKKLTNP